MKNSLIKSKTESAYRDFLSGKTECSSSVFRFVETQQAASPCIFIMAGDPHERTPGSGRWDVPVSIKLCVSNVDLLADTASLERIGGEIETALTGSTNSINSNGNNIFIFQATMPSSGQELTETTFQYGVNLMVVCKGL